MTSEGGLVYDRAISYRQLTFNPPTPLEAFGKTLAQELFQDYYCLDIPLCGPLLDASQAYLDASGVQVQTNDLEITTYGRTWYMKHTELVVSYSSGGNLESKSLGWEVIGSEANSVASDGR